MARRPDPFDQACEFFDVESVEGRGVAAEHRVALVFGDARERFVEAQL